MIKELFIVLLTLIFAGIIFAGGFLYWGVYLPKDTSQEEVFFVVRSGESLATIAENLEEEGIIKKGYFFTIYGRLTDKGKRLMPGNYRLSSSMSVVKLIEMIAGGGEDRLTIVEGWNLRDIAEFLEREGYGEKKEFYRLAGKPPSYVDGKVASQKPGEIEKDLNFFGEKPDNLPIEGYLFPDTYSISPGTSMEEIIRSFLFNFEKRITPEIKERMEERGLSLFETITLASLIEKEVASLEDKKLVSGIIKKRLEIGMRLQIDATITYLTGKRSVRVSIAETKIDSPYNTYMYEGLPKGPISNPGEESIIAVLYPEESDYLYYLSKPSGETVFSKTHEEHVRAKNNYLR